MVNKEPFYSYRSFLNDYYGSNIYRISISLEFGCPNRDESGKGGCAFCNDQGSAAVYIKSDAELEDQVKTSIAYTKSRYGEKVGLMAYFQAYTSTYAPIEEIRRTFEIVLALADFKAVTISTRPDCLPEPVLEYLKELASRYDLWVELGMQTSNDTSLELINRGHNFEASKKAVVLLDGMGIKVAAHTIIGLPGETRADFERTAFEFSKLPLSGIKLHNLHVVKGTVFESWLKEGSHGVYTMDEHEYAEELINFIRHLPPKLPLMRICSDTPNSILVSPLWWMKKGQFINYIHHQMKSRGVYQGDLLVTTDLETSNSYKSVETADGSMTLYSSFFKEKYHSSVGALSEAVEKFIKPTHLVERLEKGPVKLLDIGFGLGCNALSAFELAGEQGVEIVSLEFDRAVVERAQEIYPNWQPIYQSLLKDGVYIQGNSSIRIIWGDARKSMAKLVKEVDQKFDVIFHDAFSTTKNTELWTLHFFRQERQLLNTGGAIVTYSNALPIRAALLKCDLWVSETMPYGRSKGGTIAHCKSMDSQFLPDKDLAVLNSTTARVPYSDPLGSWSRKQILTHRDRVVKKLISLGVPKKIKYKED